MPLGFWECTVSLGLVLAATEFQNIKSFIQKKNIRESWLCSSLCYFEGNRRNTMKRPKGKTGHSNPGEGAASRAWSPHCRIPSHASDLPFPFLEQTMALVFLDVTSLDGGSGGQPNLLATGVISRKRTFTWGFKMIKTDEFSRGVETRGCKRSWKNT